MHVKILGSAAGGGFPQWNCACSNCRLVRSGTFSGKARSQTQVAISHDGAFLYAINTGSSSVSSYGIAGDGTLSLLGSKTLTGSGLRPFDAALDPSDQYLYVVDAGAAKITIFAVDGGNLTELGSSPMAIPGGGAPFGIVVD